MKPAWQETIQPVDADQIFNLLQEPLHEAIARAEPAGVFTRKLSALVAQAQRQARAQLEGLEEGRQLRLYRDLLDMVVGATPEQAQFMREVLGNRSGLGRILLGVEVARPPHVPAPAAPVGPLPQLQADVLARLDAQMVREAEAALSAAHTPVGADIDPQRREHLLLSAEETALRAFSSNDPRTVERVCVQLALALKEEDVAGVDWRFALLRTARAKLSVTQVTALLPAIALANLLVQEASASEQERQAVAGRWSNILAWLERCLPLLPEQGQGRPADEPGPAGGTVADPQENARVQDARRALRRAQRTLKRVSVAAAQVDAADLDADLEEALEDALAILPPHDPYAAVLRRRALEQQRQARIGSLDQRRASKIWLERWLEVVAGVAVDKLPSPLPAFDRAVSRQLLPPPLEEQTVRFDHFRQAWDRQIVGNHAAYEFLHDSVGQFWSLGGVGMVLLHGAPGTAKSTVAELVARSLFPDSVYAHINLADRSRADLTGVSQRFHGAKLSFFAQSATRRAGKSLFYFIDEVDKAGAEMQDALAVALEFNHAAPFVDEFLQAPINLAGDFFLLACNDLPSIKPHLRSRFAKHLVLPLAELDERERREAVWQHFCQQMRARNWLPKNARLEALLLPSFFDALAVHHGGESGLRPLLGTLQRVLAAFGLARDHVCWGFPWGGQVVSLALRKNGFSADLFDEVYVPYRGRSVLQSAVVRAQVTALVPKAAPSQQTVQVELQKMFNGKRWSEPGYNPILAQVGPSGIAFCNLKLLPGAFDRFYLWYDVKVAEVVERAPQNACVATYARLQPYAVCDKVQSYPFGWDTWPRGGVGQEKEAQTTPASVPVALHGNRDLFVWELSLTMTRKDLQQGWLPAVFASRAA